MLFFLIELSNEQPWMRSHLKPLILREHKPEDFKGIRTASSSPTLKTDVPLPKMNGCLFSSLRA